MAMSPIRQAFTWGTNGEMLSPEQVAQRRAQAQGMMQAGMDYSPVGSMEQGLARLAQGLIGGWNGRQADEATARGREGARSIIDALTGGGAVTGSLSTMNAPRQAVPEGITADGGLSYGGRQQASAPVGDMAERIRLGLIQRGLPAHVADGFVMNFQDESGLNPGINEQSPTVPGSRGGFGLAQWTGPRRVGLERAAQARGVSPADVDLQLDYLIGELQGDESRAARSILAADDAGTAAAAVARDFLRPAQEHLNRRVANYTGGSLSTMGGGNIPSGPSITEILAASADPWVQQEYGGVVNALLGQAQQREQFAMQQQAQANDPLRNLQIQQAQWDLQQSMRPAAQEYDFITAPDGTIIRTTTQGGFEPIGNFAKPQDNVPLSAIGKLAEDRRLGRIDDAQYEAGLADLAPQGMTIESDGSGGFRMVQGVGAGSKPFTEGQSKDVVYATRARGALQAFEPLAEAMISRGDRALDWVPMGIGRELQNDDYQVAQNAANEFTMAVLRKDTGAAITREETALTNELYIPQPGDSKAALAQKSEARIRAIAALEAGMSTAQILAQENAMKKSDEEVARRQAVAEASRNGSMTSRTDDMRPQPDLPPPIGNPATGAPMAPVTPGTIVNGHRFRGGNPRDRANWEPVQ